MVLLGQTVTKKDGERLIAQAPTQTPPPIPGGIGQMDWGFALAICGLVGLNLWQILKTQLSADAELQKDLIRSLLDERKILLEALVKKP